MADQWYYGRELEVMGPFCGKELARLATAGDILRTDTVWKDGVEQGVPAHRVRYLFPPVTSSSQTSASSLPVTEEPTVPPAIQSEPVVETVDELREQGQAEKVVEVPAPRVEVAVRPPTRARAVAGKGVVIVGQDGKIVRYRMKCPTCGFEDSSFKTLPITRGSMRVSFFCQKCRKQRQSDIQGHMG